MPGRAANWHGKWAGNASPWPRRALLSLLGGLLVAVPAATASTADKTVSQPDTIVAIGWQPDGPPQTFEWQLFDDGLRIVPGDTANQTLRVINRGPSAARLSGEIFVTGHTVPTSEIELWDYLQINKVALNPDKPVQIISNVVIPACPAIVKESDCASIPIPIEFEFVRNLNGRTPGNVPGGLTVSFNAELKLQGLVGDNDYIDLWEINALPVSERNNPNNPNTRLHEAAESFVVKDIDGAVIPIQVDLSGSGKLTALDWQALPGFTEVDIANITEMVQTRSFDKMPLCHWRDEVVRYRDELAEYGYPIYRYWQVTCDTELTVRHTVKSLNVKPVPGMEPVHPNHYQMNLHQLADEMAGKASGYDDELDFAVADAHRPAGEKSEATISVLNTYTYALTADLNKDEFPHDAWAMKVSKHEDYDHQQLPLMFLDNWGDSHASLTCDDAGTEDWSDGTDGTVTVLFGHRAVCDSVAHSSYLNVRTILIDASGNIIDDHNLIGEHFAVEMHEITEESAVHRPLDVPNDWLADNDLFIKVRPESHLQVSLISPESGPFAGWVSIKHNNFYEGVPADSFVITPDHPVSGLTANMAALAAWQQATDSTVQPLQPLAAGLPGWQGAARDVVTAPAELDATLPALLPSAVPSTPTYRENCPGGIVTVPAETLTPETAHQITFIVVQPSEGMASSPVCGDVVVSLSKPGGGSGETGGGSGEPGAKAGTGTGKHPDSNNGSRSALLADGDSAGAGTGLTGWLTRTGAGNAVLVGGFLLTALGLVHIWMQWRRRAIHLGAPAISRSAGPSDDNTLTGRGRG